MARGDEHERGEKGGQGREAKGRGGMKEMEGLII